MGWKISTIREVFDSNIKKDKILIKVHDIRLVTKSGVILDTCVSGGQLDSFLLWKTLNSQFLEQSYFKGAEVSASASPIPPKITAFATKHVLVEVKTKL